MNIKNQILLSVFLSMILVGAISVSIVVSYQNMRDLQQQESLAADVVRGSYELTYLSNDYLINGEPRARLQWEDRYASLQPIISQLKAGNSQEAQSLETIRDYNEKVGTLFRDIPDPGAMSPGAALFPVGYQQLTWSRINVQSQGLIYEAWRLRHMYDDDVSEARFWNNILVLALMAAMLAIISVNYLLISRRLVRSIREINAGSEVFATGDFDYRIPITADDEIGGIAHGLNRMAEQIQSVTASRNELSREIAERERAEEQLTESNERFKNVARATNDIVWDWDLETDDLWWNEAIYTVFGYQHGDIERTIQSWYTRLHPEDRDRVITSIHAVIDGGGHSWSGEYRFLRADSSYAYVFDRGFVIRDNRGKAVRMVGAMLDITGRKRAEDEIAATQQKYHELFEGVSIGILRSTPGPQGTLVEANPAALRIFGADSREQLLAVPPSDLYYDTGERRKISEEILARGGIKSMEVKYRTLKGKPIWGRITSIKKISEDGQVYFDSTIEDITDRKRAEEDLRETNEYLRNLLDYANAPIIVWDMESRITRFNHAFEHLTGRTEQEVVGQQISILFPEASRDASLELILKTVTGERWEVIEIPILHVSGETRIVLWNSANIVDPGGKIISTIAQGQDITDRKLTEVQREMLIKELEQKNAELERFTYTVSHDLKSPLITIHGFMGLLEEDIHKQDVTNLKNDINRINSATEKMESLLKDLLALSRIGRVVSPPTEVPFTTIANEAVELSEGVIRERGVMVTIAPHMPTVNVDHIRILEAVTNLVENAIKFMGDQPAPAIEIGVRKDNDKSIFFIKDNGIGIDKKYQEKIFLLFEKLDAKTGGDGAGLALVKRIIEVHGGRIWVESEGEGKGSTFCFTLPVTG